MIDIDFLYRSGFISSLDYYFALVLCRTANEKDPVVLLSAALTSGAALNGNICLDIDKYAGRTLSEPEDFPKKFPKKNQWIESLKRSSITGDSIEYPIVYDGESRLYLARYYDFQQRIVKNILKRIEKKSEHIDFTVLNHGIAKLFADTENLELDGTYHSDRGRGVGIQKQAVMNAVLRKFTIISGGPGTGKTFICEKIIELLNDQADAASMPHPRIITAAPTGKAASKFKTGYTIHRMLSTTKREKKFRYNKENPIPCDVVIVDEASMIDIALMARLLEAVPDNAGLIILGDRNQLASVEAGAVFGDICRAEMISDTITDLKYNFRSGGKSGIDRLAKAVNAGDTAEVEEVLSDKTCSDICFFEINYGTEEKIMDQILKGYMPFIEEDDPEAALEKFNMFRILCAHRKGHYGTDYFNAKTANILRLQIKKQYGTSYFKKSLQEFFIKKPVMVNVNDYKKKLFNGDTGITVRMKDGLAKVFFSDQLELKSFLFSDLPSHEDAFAMTVHKSQGSEFDHVLFVIPPRLSPVVTRELLYTGITRAKKKVTIAGSMEVIKEAVNIPVHRSSAITEMIEKALLNTRLSSFYRTLKI